MSCFCEQAEKRGNRLERVSVGLGLSPQRVGIVLQNLLYLKMQQYFFVSFIAPPVYYRHLTLYPTLIPHELWSNIPLNILTSDILVPVYGTYENLVVSSVGLKLFNLLGPSSSSTAGMSSLGCVISFSRYLVLKLVITALTVGICKSVCKIVFCTYRGALMIDRRILF